METTNMNNKQMMFLIKREFKSYFSTPLALVFIVIFLVLNGLFTFELGGFFERGQADLGVFFSFHPWLYLFLMPALAMGTWAEERKSGTIELLLTLPTTITQVAFAKFIAVWSVATVALMLTFPLWITVNYLGNPDNGVIFTGYLGSMLLAGAYLAISSCLSAMTKNQVIAFILSVVICFLFLMSGLTVVLDFFKGWLPLFMVDAISSLSFLSHFDAITKGVLDLRDIFFFTIVIVAWLFASIIIIDLKKAE